MIRHLVVALLLSLSLSGCLSARDRKEIIDAVVAGATAGASGGPGGIAAGGIGGAVLAVLGIIGRDMVKQRRRDNGSAGAESGPHTALSRKDG